MYIIFGILIILAILILRYADKNLHDDDRAMKKVWKVGFKEKQFTLDNGTVINYGEGGNSESTPLFLIHGQGQAWQDYNLVLPKLSQKFHVYTIDCHGHGKSSHDIARYNCKKMTEDFVEFIEKVIGKPCVISGHSSGGVLATNVAATCPEYIRALVIEDAPFFCVEVKEMEEKKAVVWDSFKLMNDYLNQKPSVSYSVYTFQHAVLWSLFGGLKNVIASSTEKFEKKHPNQGLKIWYIPQSMLKGMYYGNTYDMQFGITFYNSSWFDGVSQEQMLKSVKCPCTYLKAKTGYIIDGKPQSNIEGLDTTGAMLCCANTEEDANRVTSLVNGCQRVTTESSDHLIHSKYPKLFITEINKYC